MHRTNENTHRVGRNLGRHVGDPVKVRKLRRYRERTTKPGKQIRTIKSQPGEPLSDYFGRLTEIRDLLKGSDHNIADWIFRDQLLRNLPDAYANIKDIIENKDPRTRHLTAVKRVLRYLKKTKDRKLTYTVRNQNLHDFVDADWAKSANRKLVGGYAFLPNNAAISWSSKKQSLVALSTKEAEYTAFTGASRETLWLRRLLNDIEKRDNEPEPTTLFADNQAVIKHTATERITARTNTSRRNSATLKTYNRKELSISPTTNRRTRQASSPKDYRHRPTCGTSEDWA